MYTHAYVNYVYIYIYIYIYASRHCQLASEMVALTYYTLQRIL
jgi:hypothetical protein